MSTDLETETLTLPNDYSFGRITVYRKGEQDHSEFLDARGRVQVPRSAKLFLDVSQEVCDDLRRIHLVPKRLLATGVRFLERDLTRTDFRELSLLKPHCMAVTFCNNLQVKQLRQLGPLDSLEHLNLDHTQLDIPDFSWLPQFPNLKTLQLAAMGADDSCLPPLTNLRSLEEVDLRHSRLSTRGVQAVWRIPTLKSVNLGDCPIGDESFEYVGRCSALRSLKIAGTEISDKGVELIVTEALRGGFELSSLTLRACRITDKALVRLVAFSKLALIDVFSTEVTSAAVTFFKQSLPNCIILVEHCKGGGPSLWEVNTQ